VKISISNIKNFNQEEMTFNLINTAQKSKCEFSKYNKENNEFFSAYESKKNKG
jgi:hypothetical protein